MQGPLCLTPHIREAGINQQNVNSTQHEVTSPQEELSHVLKNTLYLLKKKKKVTQMYILISMSFVKCEEILPCMRGV